MEDRERRIFRVNREVFRSPQLFARERTRLWDRLWLYLGHESEVPRPGDFKQRTLAGRPLIFSRDSAGRVRAFLNACPHRGTILCRETEGNAKTFQCFMDAGIPTVRLGAYVRRDAVDPRIEIVATDELLACARAWTETLLRYCAA
jgi:nitrite reductase/ring-hydroxylating ferredoxin subunit